MQNETQGNEQQLNLAVDLGGGRQVDVEIGRPDQLWVSAGPGIGLGDVWMKGEGRLLDLRVRIRRTPGGVEIVVDRGIHGGPQVARRGWRSQLILRQEQRSPSLARARTGSFRRSCSVKRRSDSFAATRRAGAACLRAGSRLEPAFFICREMHPRDRN